MTKNLKSSTESIIHTFWSYAWLPQQKLWEIPNLRHCLSSNKRTLLAWEICQNEDLKSAMFVGQSHNCLKIFLTKDDWISSWPSWLVSLILHWCLTFTHHMRIRLLWIMSWRRRCWLCKKTFPNIPCVSQMRGGPFLRLDILKDRLSIPPESGWDGKDTKWVATRMYTAYWLSIFKISRIVHTTNFIL